MNRNPGHAEAALRPVRSLIPPAFLLEKEMVSPTQSTTRSSALSLSRGSGGELITILYVGRPDSPAHT
jgi:hypothetical protein